MNNEQELKDKMDEGMMPGLGGKKIRVGKKEYDITELPIFYTKRLQRMLSPAVGVFMGQKNSLSPEALINPDNIDKALSSIEDPAYFIMNYHYPEDFPSKETFAEVASERQCLSIIGAQLEVNGIVDFFKQLLESVLRLVATNLAVAASKSESQNG